MKVYIASMFSDKDRVLARGKELEALGIECTSRWASETVPHNVTIQDCTEEYLRETAVADIQDILRADVVVLTVPEDKLLVDATVASSSRGGRHFESGFVYGLALSQAFDGGRPTRELVILGKKENVFHYLDGSGVTSIYPAIKIISTWEETKSYLAGRRNGCHISSRRIGTSPTSSGLGQRAS
jgi:hypothetical protein